jgi:hypothetical protein
LKASALGFGRVVPERPTPSAITLNTMEENTRDAAMIFFIDFNGEVLALWRCSWHCQPAFFIGNSASQRSHFADNYISGSRDIRHSSSDPSVTLSDCVGEGNLT